MKVLYLNDLPLSGGGGTERYISRIIDEMEDRGHRTKFLSLLGKNSDIGFSDSLPLVYSQRYLAPARRRKLKNEIEQFQPDIIHVNMSQYASIPILKTLGSADATVIRTFHGYSFFSWCADGVHNEGNLCEGTLESCLEDDEISLKQYIFRKPIDFFRRRYAERAYEFGLAPSKDLENFCSGYIETHRLPNFVDTAKFNVGDNSVEDGILFFGRINESKGVDLLLEAFSSLDTSEKLKIAGSGEINKFEKLTEELNIDDRVEFLGYLGDEELVKTINSSRVVVVPSKLRETFGLVGLESMSCGTPVIGANVGGIPDYIEDGKTGYLFEFRSADDLEEKMRKFLSLDSVREKSMREEARNTAESYDITTFMGSLIEYYGQAMKTQ